MTGTTLVREFIWRVCSVLNDYDQQYVNWQETDIVNAINDGQIAIMKYLPMAFTRLDSIKLTQGKSAQSIAVIPQANIVPADGTAAPTGGTRGRQLISLDCNTSSSGTEQAIIRISDRYDYDVTDPLWMTRTGAAVTEYMYNSATPTVFHVTPAPAGSNQWVRAAYVAYPTKVPAGGAPGAQVYLFSGTNPALLSIDDANVDDLFHYVIARMNMKEIAQAKPEMAAFATNAFTSSINAQFMALRGFNPNLKHLPMMTGQAGGEAANSPGGALGADRT